MGSFKDRYNELKAKYGASDTPVTTSQNVSESKFMNRYQELMGKYGPEGTMRGTKVVGNAPTVQKHQNVVDTQDYGELAEEAPKAETDIQKQIQEQVANAHSVFGAPEVKQMTGQSVRSAAREQAAKAAASPARGNQVVEESVDYTKLAEEAQKAYDDYIQSEEYKAAEQAWYAAHKWDGLKQALQYPGALSDSLAGTVNAGVFTDGKAQQMKAVAQYYRGLAQQEADNAVMDKDMAELETWPEADKALLQQYISLRPGGFDSMAGSLGASALGSDSYNAYQMRNGEEFAKVYQKLNDKYGAARVAELAESYSRYLNQQTTQQVQEASQSAVKGKVGASIGHSAGTVAANLIGSYTSPLDVLSQIATRDKRYSTLDPNSIGNLPNVYSGAVRQQVASDIAGENGNVGRKLLSLGYQGLMSAADSGARLLAGGGTEAGSLALSALGSFGNTVAQASAQGASPAEAIALGTINAGIEALTEKIPLDDLLDTAKGGWEGLKPALINALKQAGIEATTEEISLLGTTLTEMAILQEKSSYQQTIQEQMAQGKSYEEAKRIADTQILNEAGETAIVSAISGGFSSAGSSAVAYMGRDTGGTKTAQEGAETAQNRETTVAEDAAEALIRKQEQPQAVQQNDPAENQRLAKEAIRDLVGMTAANTASTETNAISKPLDSYPAEKQNMIRSYIQAVDEKIKGFVQRVKSGDLTFKRQKISDVSARAAADIGKILGIDVSGYTHNINTNGVQHIINRHGENGKADHSMALDDDIARIGWVLENYDYVEALSKDGEQVYSEEFRNQENRPAPQIRFVKKIDGSYYVVEAACENNYKKLWVQSAYLQKNNGDVTEVPAAGPSADHEDYARGGLPSPSPDNRIPEKGGNVNTEHGAVGAAEAGFAGEFQQLQAEYGNLPAGENPVRPDDMPRSTDGTDRVSQTAVTVKGAKVTPDEFVPLLEQKVTEGALSYIPITNDQTVQKAMDNISEKGWQQALADWKAAVNSGKNGADLTATGALLLNNAAKAGDKDTWLDILDHYRRLGTNTAQGLQAFRILKTLEPSDKLYMIRKSVEQMTKEMGLKNEITIDETLASEFRNARTDEEADQILSKIIKDVARQIPSTFKDKWTALRYLNMLGNLRTQVRNIAGNVGAGAAYLVKDEIGAVLERVFLKQENRTKSFAVSKQQMDAAGADFDTVKNVIQNGGKYNDPNSQSTDFAQAVQDQRRIFKADNKVVNALLTPLEGYRKATNWAMETGDVIFSKAAYARALAGYLNARGIKETDYSKIDTALMDNARLYAIQQAQEATFRDSNTLSDWVGKIGRREDTPAWAKAMAEGILPFRKTPANVLVRAEEFSPLGLINSAVDSVKAAKGDITGAQLVESWAKTLTGTALYALGWWMGSAGLLVGGPDEDEDKQYFDELSGYQNYAIQLPGGVNFTIDFLSPLAIPMFLGAQTQKILEDGDTTLSDWEKMFTSLADPLIEMSMLQGISDTLDNIQYSESNMLQFALNAMMSYLTQGLTNTLLGQIERSTEESRMTTYIDKNSDIPVWLQRQLGKASAKTPGWDFQQTPYINEWGEEEKNPEGIANWLYQMLSPSYVDKVDVDKVSKELYRLNEVQSDVNVFPDKAETTFNYTDKNGKLHENYQLTMEEADKLQRIEGQTKAEIAAELIGNDDYKALTDSQKAEAISLAYQYAREHARVETLEDYGGNGKSWMLGIEGKEASTIINKVALGSLTDSLTTVNNAITEGWETAEAAKSMESAYNAYKGLSQSAQRQIKEQAGESAAGKYIAAREAGVTNEEYVTVLKQVAGLKPQSGYVNVRDIQEAQAVGSMKGLSNAEKEALIRGYVSDAQDENIDQVKELGFDINDYLTAWSMYDSESGEGKKKRTIAQYQQKFGIDYDTAKALYEIFG